VSVGHVALNGSSYVLTPFRDGDWIKRETVPIFAPVFVAEGQQQQRSITSYSSKTFSNLESGFGRNRIRASHANVIEEYEHFFDSTCDTRWPGFVTLMVQAEDTTHTGLERLVASAHPGFGGFWSLWSDDTSTDVVARKLSGTTWDGGGPVREYTAANEPLDLIVSGSRLVALCAAAHSSGDNANHYTRYSVDGINWSTPTTEITQELLSAFPGINDFDFDGLLAVIGGELVAAVWDEHASTVTFFSSTNDGTVWADKLLDIPSTRGVTGLAVYPDIDGTDSLYVGTPEGLWAVDTSDPSSWTANFILPMASDPNNCRRMTVHNGALWFAYGADNNKPAEIQAMTVEGDRRVFTGGLGLNVGDGPPGDLLGSVRWMRSNGEFLYIAIGGGNSSVNGRVLCHNGRGWHTVQRNGNGDKPAFWLDFDDGNLYHSFDSTGSGASTSTVELLANALVNPQSGISIKYESTGYIDLPYLDGGMPTIDATWLQTRIDASSLSSSDSGEYINIDYGANGAARTTDLGNILSGTLVLDMPSGSTAGTGVQGRNLALRVNLVRGSTVTLTPELHSVEVDYLKQPGVLDRYIFQIDLEATALLGEDSSQGNVEGVITDLETARDLATLPTFMYANLNRGTDIYVKVRDIKWGERIVVEGGDRPTAPSADAQRTGIAVVTVERVIR
jgi:hypothetical protein